MVNNKPYLVELSNKSKIQIDGDEVSKVAEAISIGTFVKVRRGFINPSFVIDIVPDKDRWHEFLYDIKHIDGTKKNRMLTEGCPRLKDAFDDVLESMQALPPNERYKRLPE